jgi:hypothetical protein
MKNATATSHGKSRRLDALGAGPSGSVCLVGVELVGLGGIESNNYFTNESRKLLECAASPFLLSIRMAGSNGFLLALLVYHLYKNGVLAASACLFLATIKRP